MRQGLDLTVRRYGRRRRRRQHAVTALLVLLCAGLAAAAVLRFGPGAAAWLSALPGRVERAVGDRLVPHFSRRLDELESEAAALRRRLAADAGLEQENAALRALLESPAAQALPGARPMQVAARTAGGFSLAGSARAGAAVLDPLGRFAGRTAGPDPDAPGLLPVQPPDGAACLAGGSCGVLERREEGWYLAGLPRHCPLQPGDLVTTADGCWVGVVAAAPAEDETGLTASALLQDTADLGAGTYFVLP